jgi:ribonuclease E
VNADARKSASQNNPQTAKDSNNNAETSDQTRRYVQNEIDLEVTQEFDAVADNMVSNATPQTGTQTGTDANVETIHSSETNQQNSDSSYSQAKTSSDEQNTDDGDNVYGQSTATPNNSDDEALFDAAVTVKPIAGRDDSETVENESVAAVQLRPYDSAQQDTRTSFESKPETTQTEEQNVSDSSPVTEADATPVVAEAIAEGPPARASNDPRLKPKTVAEVSIVTETKPMPVSAPLDTSKEPVVKHTPRPITRPANDPRARVNTAAAEQVNVEPEAANTEEESQTN